MKFRVRIPIKNGRLLIGVRNRGLHATNNISKVDDRGESGHRPTGHASGTPTAPTLPENIHLRTTLWGPLRRGALSRGSLHSFGLLSIPRYSTSSPLAQPRRSQFPAISFRPCATAHVLRRRLTAYVLKHRLTANVVWRRSHQMC